MLNSLSSQFLGFLPLWGVPVIVLVTGVTGFWAVGVRKWVRRREKASNDLPNITVLVIGRNEERFVGGCLESLLRLDYPPERLEILFVDDHSQDRTLAIAREWVETSEGTLRVLEATDALPGHGPKKHALTQAIQQATGEILLFTDADGAVSPGWARAVVSNYDDKTGAVAGATLPLVRPGFWNRMYRMERFMTSFASAAALGYGSPASVTGQNFSFRKCVFEQAGGYAQPLVASGDDDLMAQAVARCGWKVRFATGPDSVVADLRPPQWRAQINAAARHQSTVRFYPTRWRVAFAVSILAGIALLLTGVGAFFSRSSLVVFAIALVIRTAIDLAAAHSFKRQLRLPVSSIDLLTAELLLPVYLLVRPLLMLKPSFRWRNRTHRAAQSAGVAS